MKPAQKKRIKEIHGKLEEAHQALMEIELEMRDAIEAKSDKWRESETGEAAETERSNVEDAMNNTESAFNDLGNIEGLFDN